MKIITELENKTKPVLSVILKVGMAVFKSLHGHVDVKQQFIVPAESPWPEECYGLPLGRRVAMIRTRGDMVKASSERRARLSSIGLRC